MKRNFMSLIKFGEKIHMEKLLYEGEIFCKPIRYFNKIDNKNLRGDCNDGIAYIKQIRNIHISRDNIKLASAKQGQLFLRNLNDKGNIYCFYGLPTDSLNLESKVTQKLEVNLNGFIFGDFAVWIYNPTEFINRLVKVVETEGYKIQISPITYINFNDYEGELTPFHKSIIYECQSEVRVWIPNDSEEDLVFKIGNISDISFLISKDEFNKIEYEPI